MGQAVRRCADTIDDLTATCPGCSGPDFDGELGGQRRRLMELVSQVDEARQENQRLSRQAHRQRLAVQDMKPDAAALAAQDRGNFRAGQADQAVHEELLQCKRVLWDLQRENAQLKESSSRVATPGLRPGGDMEVQALKRQVEELQRAYENSLREAQRLQQQRSLTNSGSMYAGSGRQTPSTTAGFSSDDEVRRRVQAMQAENEQLKKKVRMLASN
eukprot:TRINITY_DN7247_c0_g1_i1.p1 TRINITY_DN7247_c0_g1~~TRINITY_DN7247_c0_g1_i1.p1  ORF type:complete len:216 (-),score=53.00 TRINITY_DN7247_c0_g1_i1:210-857(-)